MLHELCHLITENGIGSFLILLALIWATVTVLTAFINRNKPSCICDCCDENEDEDEEEVVAMGGEEEDHDHR